MPSFQLVQTSYGRGSTWTPTWTIRCIGEIEMVSVGLLSVES